MWDKSNTWVGSTARDIARAVRRGDASATQVVADHLDYIQAHDEALNAFRTVRAAAAITEAEAVDEQEDLANLPLAWARSASRPPAAAWSGSSRAVGWCPRTCRSTTGSGSPSTASSPRPWPTPRSA